MEDKETNTECMFKPLLPTSTSASATVSSLSKSSLTTSNASSKLDLIGPLISAEGKQIGMPLIKRSQTFTPSAAANKANYICRVS